MRFNRAILLVVACAALAKDARICGADAPDALQLLEAIHENDERIAQLKSLSLRFKGVRTLGEMEIAALHLKYGLDHPGVELSPIAFPKLGDQTDETIEIDLDQKRLRRLVHCEGDELRVDMWDGAREFSLSHDLRPIANPRSKCTIRPEMADKASALFVDLSCFRTAGHGFWFDIEKRPTLNAQRINTDRQFRGYELEGEQAYRGRECFVLRNDESRFLAYVGVEDRRLYGLAKLGDLKDYRAELLGQFGAIAGRYFQSESELSDWMDTLDEEERDKYMSLGADLSRRFTPIVAEFYLDDYRELAPGIWFAARQGQAFFDSDPLRTLKSRLDVTLVDFKVNEPLPDDLFKFSIPKGTKVRDETCDPPNIYSQRSNEAPAKVKPRERSM